MVNEQAANIKAPEVEKQVEQPAMVSEPQLAAEEEAKVEVQVRNNEKRQSGDDMAFFLSLSI